MFRLLTSTLLLALSAAIAQTPGATPAPAAPPRPARQAPPTRDPYTPGYVTAKDLPDGADAPVKTDGNFIIGPTHNAAPEMTAQEGVPQGAVYDFTMESTDSKFYPGIAREQLPPGQRPPVTPGAPMVVNSHPAPYTRKVSVY